MLTVAVVPYVRQSEKTDPIVVLFRAKIEIQADLYSRSITQGPET
jgi:hypothetical protein